MAQCLEHQLHNQTENCYFSLKFQGHCLVSSVLMETAQAALRWALLTLPWWQLLLSGTGDALGASEENKLLQANQNI